jgi:hypothetical protein
VGASPDSDATSDFSATNCFAEPLRENHEEILHACDCVIVALRQ